jgi:spore maturation protein B
MTLIIPIFVVFTVFFGLFKKEKVFSLFCEGAKEGLKTVFSIFPSVLGLVVAVECLSASSFFTCFSKFFSFLSPYFPGEILPMALIKPLSGSGSFAVLNDILSKHGANSFIGLSASAISGATETTFYSLSVYYASTNATKLRYNVGVSVFCDILSFVLAVFTIRLFLF